MIDTLALCDIHVHVGHFRGLYFSPQYVVDAMRLLHVKRWAVSSTSTCAYIGGYDMASRELREIIELAPNEAIPILWLTPDMIEESPNLNRFEEIPYRMLKVHGYSHDWHTNDKLFEQVFIAARKRSLPVLIHTGGRPESDAGRYTKICKSFSDIIIILAHGRPIDETIKVMKQCPNVWVDTAFMPIEDIQTLIDERLEKRVVFGSDYPLDAFFFPKQSEQKRYRKNIRSIIKTYGEEQLSCWAIQNFATIVGK
ncbi:MAG: amidohydrolase family protein [Desulfuromonadaceae bacterium]